MKIQHSRPCYIFAHRGATHEAAENTRQAFDKALMYAIDGIETDVQLTQNEVSVLYHDRFLDKLGFPDKRIDNFTYEELKQMNFAGYFVGSEPEGVFTLKEFVDQYRSRCKLQIEIKNRDWEDPQRHQIKMQQCLNILGASENLDVFISSFNLDCLKYANKLGTEIPLVCAFNDLLSLSDIKRILNQEQFLAGICHHISTLNADLVDFLRDYDKLIVTYTCNTQQEIQKALDLEVDVLITDEPAKALQLRG